VEGQGIGSRVLKRRLVDVKGIGSRVSGVKATDALLRLRCVSERMFLDMLYGVKEIRFRIQGVELMVYDL